MNIANILPSTLANGACYNSKSKDWGKKLIMFPQNASPACNNMKNLNQMLYLYIFLMKIFNLLFVSR